MESCTYDEVITWQLTTYETAKITIMQKLTFLLLIVAISIETFANDPVFQWRGNNRHGIYNETDLLSLWPETGPSLAWQTDQIGNGYVSPVCTTDAIFITGETDSLAHLFKFDFQGKLIWKIAYDKEWVKNYPGARSHPTIIDGLVYVGSGMGNLFCIDAQDGTIKWSRKFADDFQGQFPLFGHSEAPAIDGELIFWTPGGKTHNVVALNRFNGELIWSNPGKGECSGYNNPIVFDHNDRKILVTFSAYHLLGFDAATGQILWTHEQTNIPLADRGPGKGDTHANTVLYENGTIYYAEGDGNGGVKLQLSDDGSQIIPIWHNQRFDSYMGGFIKLGNQLYGSATAKPLLLAANAETGELTDSLKIGNGAIIAANNKLYYYNFKGQVFLVDYSSGKLKTVSAFKVTQGSGEHFAHPVIHRGVLYIRHGKSLQAYNIQKKEI